MTDFARLVLDADTRGLKRGQNDLRGLSGQARNTAQTVDRSNSNMSTSFGGVARSIVPLVAGFGGFALGIRSLIDTNAQFGQSMQRVSAISGATGDELQSLSDTAKELGSSTQFSASQAADALGFLAMAGFSASESMQAIPNVLALAAAGSLELSTAADIASNVISGFGKEAGEAGIVADVLASAASRTNTSVSQLGQALSTAAPIAASLGISLEETAAAIGVMSDAGIQGERAGTALRGVFASLAGPTTQAQEALARYGLTAQDIDPQTVGLSNAMASLADVGLTTADAMVIFGREAASGALVMADAADRTRELTEEFRNADGAAQDMAATMANNLNGDIREMSSAFEGLQLEIGEGGATGTFRILAQTATEALRAITTNLSLVTNVLAGAATGFVTYRGATIAASLATTTMTTNLRLLFGAVATTTSRFGVLAGAQVAMAGATAGATSAFRGLTAALISNPIGLVAAAVGTLTAAFLTMRDAQISARSETDNLTRSLGALSKQSASTILGRTLALRSKERTLLEDIEKLEGRINSRRGRGAKSKFLNPELDQARTDLARVQGALVRTDVALKQVVASSKQVAIPVAQSATAIKSVAPAATSAAGSVSKAREAVDTFGASLDRLMDRLFPAKARTNDYRQDQIALNRALKEGRIDADSYGQALGRLASEFASDSSVFNQGGPVQVLQGNDDIDINTDEISRELEDFSKRALDVTDGTAKGFAQMAQSVSSSLQGLAGSIRGGGFLGILQGAIGLFGQLSSTGIFGSSLQTSFGGAPSFNGGGFTGNAPRSGGLDGQGGFMAMLHPRETVVDHTRGQSSGQSVVVINNSAMAEVFVDGQIQRAAPAIANAGARVADANNSLRQSRTVRR